MFAWLTLVQTPIARIASTAREAEASREVVSAKAPTHPGALDGNGRRVEARPDRDADAAARAALDAPVESVDSQLLDRGNLPFLLAELATEPGEQARDARHGKSPERSMSPVAGRSQARADDPRDGPLMRFGIGRVAGGLRSLDGPGATGSGT
ncbi:MAG: hypothetical protein AB1730_04925 [Myxococcota bacterium]|jgi:hypothetical protein